MTRFQVKKMAVSFSLLSFAVLTFGSALAGSRLVTAFIRGVEAALLFGAVAWGLGSLIMNGNEAQSPKNKEEAPTESHLDETV